MKKLLYNTPLHSFMLVPALIFFLFVYNYSFSSFHSTVRSYEVALLFSSAIFTTMYFLFKKNKHKAGVVTTALMLVLFFYGFIYELAEKMYYKGWWPFSEIHRYVLLFIFVLALFLFYSLFKAKRSFHSITLALNVFVIIFFTINLGSLSTAILKKTAKPIQADLANMSKRANDSMPDIYYIILDGYAQDSILSFIYNYKENSLTGFMQKNNFYIASQSRTNYIATVLSLSSSLNYSYLDSLNSHITSTDKNVIYENKASEYLKEKGYKVVHIRSGYSVTRENQYADTTLTLENLGEFERTLLRYTIFRLDDILGYARFKTLKEQLAVIHRSLDIRGPKYTFIHIVSPHPPYVCDENGNYKTSPRVVNVWWEPKKDYLAQLKYINKEVINILSEIKTKSKNPPVIIVQSDHGPWAQAASFRQLYETRSRILNAYFIPYKWKDKLYSSITPVNSFRFIFNGLFGDSIPMTKDIPLDSASVMQNANTNLMAKDIE